MQTLRDILAAVLGADHDLIPRLPEEVGDVEPTRWADYEGADETLALLADVTDDEIRDAVAAIREAIQADGADIPSLTEAGMTLRFVLDARAEDDALAEIARAEALAALDEPEPEVAEPVAEEGGDGDGAEGESEDGTGDEAAPAAEAPAEPVAARQPSLSQMANRVPRPNRPLPTNETVQAATDETRFVLANQITTPGGTTYRAGQEVGYTELGDIMAAALEKKSNGQHTVASRVTHYDESQRLGSDVVVNSERIEAARQAMLSHDPALMASVCAPPTPIYDIRVLSTTDRPVRDFLPGFQATRGGVIFRPGLTFADAGTVNSDTSGVTGPWTDGDSAKNVLSVTCPNTETATVKAIAARAEISIMQNRFDPESVAAILRRQAAFQARVAENNLLNLIEAGSVALTFDPVIIVGVARLWLLQVNQLAAAIRNRERMSPDAPLDLLAPAWLVQALQDDLTLEHPGAAQERLATTQAQIEDWLRVRNVRVSWFLDGDFTFAAQSAAEMVDYPQRAEMYMFEPGHHLFLDGGSLNIDTIYDSTLLNTNEFQTLFETFESVASVGVASYTIEMNVCRTGTSGDGAEVTCGEVS